MGIFTRTVTGKIKLEDVINNYDATMINIVNIGKSLYQGYLPDDLLKQGQYSHLAGFHDYKVYTELNDGKKKRRKTLRLPKIISKQLNKYIYTENVKIYAESETNKEAAANISEFINGIIEKENYWEKSKELSETMYSMGGKVEKPRVENGEIKIDYLTADNFHPLAYNNKQVYSGVFWNKKKQDGYFYTKLIWVKKVENGFNISKELYKSKDGIYLGNKVPYETLYDDVETYTLENFSSIPFTYCKTAQANDVVLNSPMGVPIWLAGIDTIGYSDLTFDQMYREIKFGGLTRTVPQYATKKQVKINNDGSKTYTSVYDPNDETFIKLNYDPNNEKQKFEDVTPQLRYESFIAIINNALDIFAFQTGFSVGSFRFDGKSVKTATEVLSEKEDTYKTVVEQEKNLANAHANLFMSCVELANAFELDERVKIIPDDLVIKTDFDDSIIVDDETEAKKALELSAKGDIPRWYGVMKSLKVSEKRAKELVAEAKQEDDISALLGIEAQEDES
jgi:A118 family predicted phage portal protein